MSLWDRVRNLFERARELGPLPRRLISGLGRYARGAPAVVRTLPRPAPLVKFSISFTYRDPDRGTGTTEVLEVAAPRELVDGWSGEGNPSELGRWIRDQFYDQKGYILIYGIQKLAIEPPVEPRLSLPRAIPQLRRNPVESAIRSLGELPMVGPYRRGRPSHGLYYGFINLDLDSVRPNGRSIAAWARRVDLHRQFEWRASSGQAGSHARLRIREGVTPRQALALRIALGDDPIRATIDASRYAYHGKGALGGVLFDRKGEETAGPWHKSKRRR